MNREWRFWTDCGPQRHEAVFALTAVQNKPTHRGIWVTHTMTRLSRFGAIAAVVLLICIGLFTAQVHRMNVPPDQYGRFAIQYGRWAIGDFLDYVESKLSRPSVDFRFENYNSDELGSTAAMAQAAETDLYKVFPKGTEVQPFVDFIHETGGTCVDSEQPGSPLFCNYRHPRWRYFIRYGLGWGVQVSLDESREKIENFEIDVRVRM